MKKTFIFFAMVMVLCSCHHIDDTKYEKIYFQDFKKDIEGGTTTTEKISDGIKDTQKEQIVDSLPQKITEQAKTMPQMQQPQAPKNKRKVKIGELTIESDSMTFNKDTSVAVFSDNVRVRAQGVNLLCDRLKSVNYRDNAEATGNVRINYPQQKVKITCKKVKYNKSMSKIEAYENVIAEKILDNNEKINLYADEIKYDVETGEIIAIKVTKKVKIKLKDIVAFSDRVIYNEITEDLELTGSPFARKQESTFISSKINIDVNKRIITLKENIWAKLFYSDFEDIKKEVEVEKDSHRTPYQDIQK